MRTFTRAYIVFCWIIFAFSSAKLWAVPPYPQSTWGSVQVTVHSESEAQDFFEILKEQKDLAWDYPADQCYARAYLSSWILSQKGVRPITFWNVAREGAPLLRVETSNDPRGCLVWRYHVATGVVVARPSGELVGLVLDPAMADEPLDLWAWVLRMKLHYPENLLTEVWSSHPYAYRREDLGAEESNRLLAEGNFRTQVLDRYWRLVRKN